jgi:hypothetical protein
MAGGSGDSKKIKVWNQPGQIVHKTLSEQMPNTKQGWQSGSSDRGPA